MIVPRLATPCGSSIHPELARSAVEAAAAGQIRPNWDLESGLHVPDNRNRIWHRWCRSSAPALVMVDSDIAFGPGVIPAMMEALSPSRPVVFVDVPVPSCPSNAWNFLPGEKGLEPAPWFPVPFDCDLGGTGMIAFHSSMSRLAPVDPFTRLRRNGYLVTEDTSFGYRMRDLGIRYICLPAQDIIHYKERPMRPRTT